MKRFWMQSVKFSLGVLALSGASSVGAAFPTAVNNQITDAVVQDTVTDAPAEAKKDHNLSKQRTHKAQRSLEKA
jgi:hypothetical protein